MLKREAGQSRALTTTICVCVLVIISGIKQFYESLIMLSSQTTKKRLAHLPGQPNIVYPFLNVATFTKRRA